MNFEWKVCFRGRLSQCKIWIWAVEAVKKKKKPQYIFQCAFQFPNYPIYHPFDCWILCCSLKTICFCSTSTLLLYAMETLISVHSRLQKSCYHYKAFQIGFIRKLFFVGKEDVSPKVKGFVFAQPIISFSWLGAQGDEDMLLVALIPHVIPTPWGYLCAH